MEPLVSRRYIECVSESRGKIEFDVEDSVEGCIAFVKVKIFTLEIIVVAAVSVCAGVRELFESAVLVTVCAVRRVAEHVVIPVVQVKVDRDISVSTVLEISICAKFEPVGDFGI